MKLVFVFRIFLVLALSAGPGFLFAQITITKPNMPVAGQNYIYTTSNDSIDVSVTGANQTWDFSNIVPVSQDTFKYITAAKASPVYALSFNGDAALDLKLGTIKGAFSFFKTNTGDYQQDGLGITVPGVGLPTPLKYTSPDTVYKFPVKYGNSDSCHFTGSATLLTYTIWVIGKRVNMVDGWGKVKTPWKTYDCIRVKSIVTETDSFLGAPIDRSRIEYKWLSTSEQIPVFEAIVTPNMGTGGQSFVLQYKDSFKVIVNPNGPQVDFNVADTNVFINSDSILFNNTTTGGLTYNWTITPATYSYAAGTKATSKNPQVIFNAVGLYTVSLTATGIGGSNTLTKKNYINATQKLGIQSAINTNLMQIYPNPTSGAVSILINGYQNSGKADLTLSNMYGEQIWHKTTNTSEPETYINLKGISPGIYLLKWQSGSENYLGKVVVR